MLNATGVILAGGKSLRMGTDKAVLMVGREKMVEHIAHMLQRILPEVLISSNDPETCRNLGLPVVTDILDNKVPLCGIHAALSAAKHEYVFVIACDMPFVEDRLVSLLIQEGEGYDVAVPRHGGYLEPLVAVYRKNCIPAIEKYLFEEKKKTDGFFGDVRVNYVDMEEHQDIDKEAIFFNVNTPQDLKKARDIAKASSPPSAPIKNQGKGQQDT